MTKQPKRRRILNKDERMLIAISLQMASEKFKVDANFAPARSLAASYHQKSIEVERLAAIIAEADFIVLETKGTET
jgi:hypothetical protein